MKLTVFQSDSGDCLLLETDDPTRVLVDGGMGPAYRDHVAPALGRLREAGGTLDLVYLSHIDEDHIAGVLELMQDELDWRVHEFQVQRSGNPGKRPPKAPRPPEVKEVWHNGFKDQLGMSEGPIVDMLATTAAVLEAGSRKGDGDLAQRQREIATSVGQAIELSRHLQADLLKIPLNQAFGKKLALVRDGQKPITMGSLKLTVIGPFEEDLVALRKEWDDWLSKPDNVKRVASTKARLRDSAKQLATGDVKPLRSALEQEAAELGKRSDVTAPNLASLMVLAEDPTATVLLTGDGHVREVLRGLEQAGRMDAQGNLHVDVLKVPHHGAVANITEEFCRRVTADHYVFCGNGAHHNPERRVVELIVDSRLAQPGTPFKLWFNSSEKVARGHGKPEHMREIETLVGAAAGRHPDRVAFAFLEDSSFEVPLP